MPSAVLRNTSLTMRQRFTPARACSTRTRICPDFRLLRFSAALSSPPGGFFFRLARLGHCRLVSLEPAIPIQGSPRRVGDPLMARDGLARPPADAGPPQDADALAVRLHDGHVLVA